MLELNAWMTGLSDLGEWRLENEVRTRFAVFCWEEREQEPGSALCEGQSLRFGNPIGLFAFCKYKESRFLIPFHCSLPQLCAGYREA